MDYLHNNKVQNEKSKQRNLQHQGISALGLHQAPMLTLGCPISIDCDSTRQSQSSEDKENHVGSLDNHHKDTKRNLLKREASRLGNFIASSSSLSDGSIIVGLNQDKGNHSMDNILDDEENETMLIESAQSVKQKLNGCGRNTTSASTVGNSTQDYRIQPERQQYKPSGDNVLGNKKHAAVEDKCQKSESTDSYDIWPPLGSHSGSCPESFGTNVLEGFQAGMTSMNQVQIDQDVLRNANFSNTLDSPHQDYVSVITSSNEFRGSMEDIVKIGSASQFQWPKWTVSNLLESSDRDMDTLVTYYRILNLANDLSDEDLRLFLEEQLQKEKAGLLEDTIKRRLRTGIHGSSTALTEREAMGENADTCSICMAEFKDSDRIACLYYCSHKYHADCIREWLLKSNVCPLCRTLAIIPEQYPDWNGDIRLHRAFFMKK